MTDDHENEFPTEDKFMKERQRIRLRLLAEMNEVYCVVDDNGKAVIYYKHEDSMLSRVYWGQTTYWEFEQFLRPKKIPKEKGAKDVRIAPVWFRWPGRRTFKGVMFDPEHEYDGWLNLWQGWAVKPRKGDWSLLRELVQNNLCDGQKDQYEYVFNWIAHMFQHPGSPAEVALVFRSKKGSGKGTLGRALAYIAGMHGLHISSPEHFTGRFNGHLRNCIFLFSDEAIAPRDKAATSRLKALVTEPTITIESKGKDLVTAQNLIHVVIASNEDWVVPASFDERRFFVSDANDERIGHKKFFGKLNKQLKNGGYEAFLRDMLRRDISGWHPRQSIPATNASKMQKILSMPPVQQWWFSVLNNGELPFEHVGDWSETAVRAFHEDVRDAYILWCQKNRVPINAVERSRNILLCKALGEICGDHFSSEVKMEVPENRSDLKPHGDGRQWAYSFPSLQHCREEMDRLLGIPHKWPK